MAHKLDLDALAALQNEMSKGDGSYLNIKKVTDSGEFIFRPLPPRMNMHGVFIVVERGYWIDGTFYVSPHNPPYAKGHDPIKEEIELARASGDPELLELLDGRNFNESVSYYMNVLQLEEVIQNRKASYKVVDDEPKILQANKTIAQGVAGYVTHPRYGGNSEFGILDSETGYNMSATKTVTGSNTKYSVTLIPTPCPMDGKYYTEEALPDLPKMLVEKIKPEAYLRGVIRNFLYGEPMPQETAQSTGKAKKGKASAGKAGKGSAGKASMADALQEEE